MYIFISGRINEVLIEKVNMGKMCGYADARINFMDMKKKCYKILNDFINQKLPRTFTDQNAPYVDH